MRARSGSGRARLLATVSAAVVGVVAGTLASLVLPAGAAAHPLGNFTINHYAGIVVGPGEIRIDFVIDQAEIPTFEERRRFDDDGDGELSDAEIAAAEEQECGDLTGALYLAVDRAEVPLQVAGTGLTFPLGAGLPTMRLVCEYTASFPNAPPTGVEIEFADRSFVGRLGWHEIVVEGDGMVVEAIDGAFLAESLSDRLTDYPADFLTKPLSMSAVRFSATPGGGAQPIATPAPGAPGGPPAEGLPAIFGATDLSPTLLLMSLLAAAGLGAWHALTPGHGKTLVAAWLVGTRGTAAHAVGLGLAVTVSHTLGVLALAALVLVAQQTLAPDLVARILPLVAAVGIVAIGGWMLTAELRRLRLDRRAAVNAHGHSHAGPNGPAGDRALTRRSLFALGLAGGIVPSASALLILLGAIAAGRAGFGIVLVVAFGLGMALVLVGVGLAVVRARGWAARIAAASRLRAMAGYVPLVASILVLGVGAWLTLQAVNALRP
jgi:ABC-type nickel/cobalt efflux system permease component RcnA